jgi:DNA gyrase subunit A
LCRYVKGPDFPTGGQILNSVDELKEIYKTGSGTVRLRATWDEGPETASTQTIYIESIPVVGQQAALVERIAEVVSRASCRTARRSRTSPPDDVRMRWS